MSDGGQAFPTLVRGDVMTEDGWRQREWIDRGMSLRDYFAAKAMSGWLASFGDEQRHPAYLESGAAAIARLSYQIADEMLKAREPA